MAYTAKDITVLEGLEPVRKRPGMYIGGVGSAGLHHLVWETLDNSIDEAMNGHASNIRVTLHKDGSSITIEDDGSGFPFSGAYTLDELEMLRLGPRSIKRRVRTLGGDLVIESRPTAGSNLKINIPAR